MPLKKKGMALFFFIVFMLGTLVTGVQEQDAVDRSYFNIRDSSAQYDWEAHEVTFQNEGMTLIGTLTVPDVKRSKPIILILHGYGGERNGFPITGLDNEGYFDVLARRLAENGFCSFRFDFRGSGESTAGGTVGYEVTSFMGQVSDAIAALDYIQTLDDPINPDKIGVVGHSQGGLIASVLASVDDRVESVALWAATGYPPHDFEGLLLREGIEKGIALEDGTWDNFGLYVDGVYLFDMAMSKEFFVDLFSVNPLVAVSRYEGPLMYVSPLQDIIVWPQPFIGQTFLKYHEGDEKLVMVDAGHNFNYLIHPDQVIETANWTVAWFEETLRRK